MTKSRTTTIAIAAGVVVLGIVVYFLWLQPAEPSVSISGYGPASEAQAVFLNLAAQLEPVAFDPRVLSDARFVSLIDIHTGIVPEVSGRNDPFAPL